MAEERVQRRLAAILAADVVGYSRLMERDEAGTLTTLKTRRRNVLEPLVARHQGRIFKITGDGVLIEFASAVNAVQCAVDLQHDMAAANGDQTDDRHIVLRIGINLGDVMVEGGDLYGEGINVAARLEALAEPGGILISGTAHEYVKNKVKVGFDDLGPQTLKNIADPVRAYRVTGTPALALAQPKPVSDRPSIAVLPFTNMSGDPEQEYFSDGMTEDIITELSRFRSLLVIARNSSFSYKGRSPRIQDVGRELGVRYVIEGSVRKSGDRLRVTAQLVEAPSGVHIWADRYDRGVGEIFVVQDELVRTVVSTVAGRVEEAGKARARGLSEAELRAYDLYLRALVAMDANSPASYRTAQELLHKAVHLDPAFAQAHHKLSLAKSWSGWPTGPRTARRLFPNPLRPPGARSRWTTPTAGSMPNTVSCSCVATSMRQRAAISRKRSS